MTRPRADRMLDWVVRSATVVDGEPRRMAAGIEAISGSTDDLEGGEWRDESAGRLLRAGP